MLGFLRNDPLPILAHRTPTGGAQRGGPLLRAKKGKTRHIGDSAVSGACFPSANSAYVAVPLVRDGSKQGARAATPHRRSPHRRARGCWPAVAAWSRCVRRRHACAAGGVAAAESRGGRAALLLLRSTIATLPPLQQQMPLPPLRCTPPPASLPRRGPRGASPSPTAAAGRHRRPPVRLFCKPPCLRFRVV